MSRRFFGLISTAAALALGLGAAQARAADPAAADTTTSQPTTAELMKKIDQLQAKVQHLEAQQAAANGNSTTQAVERTAERVLTDAEKRSQLLQLEGFTAGYSKGRFMLGSAAADFTLMPFLQLQLRNSTNIDTSGEDNTENGFSLPRVKFGADGNLFGSELTYFFLWNSGDSDGGGSGSLVLEQAWAKWKFADQMAVRGGQFVDPVFKEQLTASQYLMAADRSLMNLIITGADESYTQGITLIYTTDKLNLEVGFTDGVNSGNSSFRDFPISPANFGVAGRVEFTASGTAAAYRDFSAMKNSENLLVFGAGGDWTQSGDTNNFLHTIDVQWENTGGLSIFGAYVGQFIQNGAGTGLTGVTGGTDDKFNWGLLAQVSYMFNEHWEGFVRYDYTHVEDEIAVGGGGETEENLHEATGGVNYYFYGHNAKFTFDLTYLPAGAPSGAANLGILSSDDDEFVIRGQFQIML